MEGKLTMVSFKKGDKVRIKDRADWWLPSKYKLANATGIVADVIEEPEGYITVTLDSDISGIDKRIPLGFRIEDIEKIS
jgi:hypothetical protein